MHLCLRAAHSKISNVSRRPSKRARTKEFTQSPSLETLFLGWSFFRRCRSRFLRVGQTGIDAVRERTDVIAQRKVGAVDRDRDGRQDERVFLSSSGRGRCELRTHEHG
jgi:hypothetical protein